MQIGVVGINHKNASLAIREKLAQVCHKRLGHRDAFIGDRSFVLLSTCNRTEIYFTAPYLSETHTYLLHLIRPDIHPTLDQKLYSFFGDDCFTHLCRVTAGLDSAIVGESEIQRQVKCAYQDTAEVRSLPSILHFAFQKALKIGKDLRTEFPLSGSIPQLDQGILHIGNHFHHQFLERPFLFIGASQTNRHLIHFFKQKKASSLTLINRTDSTSYTLSLQENIHFLPWKHLHAWIDYDTIILGTKSPTPLIHACALSSPKLILDLSVPRNADPSLSYQPQVTLYNIDQINRLLNYRQKKLNHLLIQAERFIKKTSFKYTRIFAKKSLKRNAPQRHRENFMICNGKS